VTKALAIGEALLFEVCHRFLQGDTPAEIAAWLDEQVEHEVTREAIYPLIRRAKRDGFFRLVAPEHITLKQRIADYYKAPTDRVHISNVRGQISREYVADRAAHGIVELIENIAKKKKHVRLGLGGGGTVMRVAKNIAFLLRNESLVKHLAVHTLTGGMDPASPLNAANSFLTFFEAAVPDISYQGLFVPPVVAAEDYKKVVDTPGIAESFRRASEIDIVVTSVARADDEHGELHRLMKLAAEREERGTETVAALEKENWVGDAMYRPFSPSGPIISDHGARAVSLFELPQLVEMAKKPNKHVVLVVTPCTRCRESKQTALAPLLSEESLRIWNHLYLDAATAQALVPRVA
jgi:DNA-binding transcriptional regulator LsrR (DeoR family)